MKIVFTGGGTGGHFYPIIAVAEAVQKIVAEERLLPPSLYYIAPTQYDEQALFENDIQFIKCPAGKVRRYFSVSNFTDAFVTLSGTFKAFFTLLKIYPDVVFSKGGFASVPTVLAAHLLRIPIIIHESDSKPGKANLLAAKYAYRIAVTFNSSIPMFPEKTRANIARTGIPIRAALAMPLPAGAAQELGLDANIPTIFILGGSTGSKKINEVVLQALPDLTSFANVIHQTGKDNFTEVEATAKVILGSSEHANRYHAFPFLGRDAMRMAAGAASLVVSRAGATSITEISLWHKPSILIPIPESVSHDQRTNAYAYAHTGAAEVLEEHNMTPHILASEARRITSDQNVWQTMANASMTFANADAAALIAKELIRIGMSHNPTEAASAPMV
ncbi:MAG: UDP-N-acetylglucosamine--N-acetylmuramyl-(pentapeptide) pyrophosphoryl-undecaprenol N-acetylglucosam [Parcubacteria bacterium C7867-008]|nr:MAG: UDP-N-acetylglucosamine--N-acetylmuramyl-(pentapeptide) pyrophosphoryl-undecaprenol N-acetylglucosam [Parcubacteria bacterium C7867-008]